MSLCVIVTVHTPQIMVYARIYPKTNDSDRKRRRKKSKQTSFTCAGFVVVFLSVSPSPPKANRHKYIHDCKTAYTQPITRTHAQAIAQVCAHEPSYQHMHIHIHTHTQIILMFDNRTRTYAGACTYTHTHTHKPTPVSACVSTHVPLQKSRASAHTHTHELRPICLHV